MTAPPEGANHSSPNSEPITIKEARDRARGYSVNLKQLAAAYAIEAAIILERRLRWLRICKPLRRAEDGGSRPGHVLKLADRLY